MRLVSFNLESLFDRAKALNLATWDEGKPVLDAYGRLNQLLAQPLYSAADKQDLLDGLDALGVLHKDDAGPFVLLRQNRGKLLKRPTSGPVQVVATLASPRKHHGGIRSGGCRPAAPLDRQGPRP